MTDSSPARPDETAVRTALWRALHLDLDSPPHVFEDRIGLALVAPDADWRERPDMGPFTRPFRASILARARFVEDRLEAEVARGVGQVVLLGAGLDTLAQRRRDLGPALEIFELDRPGPQTWKQQRLEETGHGRPANLHFVPLDFEGGAWLGPLVAAGFDSARPAVVASTGVSMYLTVPAIRATLRQAASLAPGSVLVMSFLRPLDQLGPEVRPGVARAVEGARASGTPFLSFFDPPELLALAREAGFGQVAHVASAELADRYFAGRSDGLRPPDRAEELLVARVPDRGSVP